MAFTYLQTRRENESIWVEIHNPPVNFLTMDLLEELHLLIRQVSKDDTIRVFILTGGRDDSYIMHFSIHELMMLTNHIKRMLLHIVVKFKPSSTLLKYYMTFNNWLMDLFPWFERLSLSQARSIRSFSTGMYLWLQMQRLYVAIERMNKITIAAINGPCNGGGTEISACFDFRFMVANQGFTIAQPECLINIIPGGGGTQRLPRLIGRAKALELMIRGNQLSPHEAKQIGLVTDIFDKTTFKERVQAFADQMSKRPPVAIQAIKTAVLEGMDTSLRHGLSIELAQSIRCFDTADTKMALHKYMQYIDNNIMTIDIENATTAEIVGVLHTTLEIMENAQLFERFEGK